MDLKFRSIERSHDRQAAEGLFLLSINGPGNLRVRFLYGRLTI